MRECKSAPLIEFVPAIEAQTIRNPRVDSLPRYTPAHDWNPAGALWQSRALGILCLLSVSAAIWGRLSRS